MGFDVIDHRFGKYCAFAFEYGTTLYHIISYHLFSFRKSVQDYIIHMDMEIVIFVGIKG